MSDSGFGYARVRDIRDVQRRLDVSERERELADTADLLVDGDRRLILRSPSGHYWQITVGDDGTLATTDLGTSVL